MRPSPAFEPGRGTRRSGSDRGQRDGSRVRRHVWRMALGAVLVAALVLVGTGLRVWQVARADERRSVDMAIVLGAAQYHGEPSEVLEARLEQALELYQQNLTSEVVTVGGRLTGDEYTEAQVSEKWLVEHGVPADRIHAVDVGSDTLGSLRAVARLGDQNGWDSALIVSDPWHSLRAKTMGNDIGLRTWVSPTRSGPTVQTREIQSRYIFRETMGLLYYRLTHASAKIAGNGVG